MGCVISLDTYAWRTRLNSSALIACPNPHVAYCSQSSPLWHNQSQPPASLSVLISCTGVRLHLPKFKPSPINQGSPTANQHRSPANSSEATSPSTPCTTMHHEPNPAHAISAIAPKLTVSTALRSGAESGTVILGLANQPPPRFQQSIPRKGLQYSPDSKHRPFFAVAMYSVNCFRSSSSSRRLG